MKVDTVLINAKVVLPTEIVEAGVAIDGGRIVAIGKEPALPEADRTIDVEGRLLMPGAIDGHVHLGATSRQPGGEDLASGSGAAAVGGVTLVGLMPSGEVLTENGESFRRNRAAYEGRSVVDFSMLGAFSGGEGKDFGRFIPELWEEGAIAIKGYMHNHRPHRRLKASYDGEMLWALENIAKVGGIANVHCENEWMQEWNRNNILKTGRRDAEAYLKFSPPIVEYEAGRRFLYFCKVTGARGLMVHTSLPELVEEKEASRREGCRTHVETCPQYLYFTEDDMREKGVWFKCAPTLRDRGRVEGMWRMLDRGYVDTIASDHVPISRSALEEAQARNDLFGEGGGMPNIEFMVSSLMNGVNRGWTNLFSAVRALAENPARIYGLWPRKGVIQLGADADLVVVDMDREVTVTPDILVTRAARSPFEGRRLKGIPVLTLARGEIVAREGEVLGKPGYGKFVPRLDAAR